MVLATSDLHDLHALKCTHDLGWLQDSIAARVTKAKLALVRITTTEDLTSLGHEHRVSSTSLQIPDWLITKGFRRE